MKKMKLNRKEVVVKKLFINSSPHKTNLKNWIRATKTKTRKETVTINGTVIEQKRAYIIKQDVENIIAHMKKKMATNSHYPMQSLQIAEQILEDLL